jgi:hypothetical protein
MKLVACDIRVIPTGFNLYQTIRVVGERPTGPVRTPLKSNNSGLHWNLRQFEFSWQFGRVRLNGRNGVGRVREMSDDRFVTERL